MKKIAVVLLLVFLFSSLLVVSNNNIYLFREGGLALFGKTYLSWVVSVGSNLVSITGNFIKSGSSQNSTKL